jgi:hypothetical protein
MEVEECHRWSQPVSKEPLFNNSLEVKDVLSVDVRVE